MTRNQIEYFRAVESKRSNQANEAITQARDAQNAAIQWSSLDETKRSNQAKEQHAAASLSETIQHNRNTESISMKTLEEQQRHALRTEALQADNIALGYANLAEQSRANQAREAETHRANVANETENNRANVARETETNRANLAFEAEQNRANVAKETETHRTNLSNETIKMATLEEQVRAAQANELLREKELGIRGEELAEKKRHNEMGEFVSLVDAIIPF